MLQTYEAALKSFPVMAFIKAASRYCVVLKALIRFIFEMPVFIDKITSCLKNKCTHSSA